MSEFSYFNQLYICLMFEYRKFCVITDFCDFVMAVWIKCCKTVSCY